MLLTQEQMKSLKRVNASKDTEKTKERIKEDFSAASAAQKRAIAEAAGQVINSFYTVYKTGTATAKVLLALASELNVSPFYYTGETDEKEPCSDELVIRFLEELGDYADLVDELKSKATDKPKRKYTRKPKAEAAADDPANIQEDCIEPEAPASCCGCTDEDTTQESINDICEEEAVILLKALFIRAKADGNAAVNLEEIKRRLLS